MDDLINKINQISKNYDLIIEKITRGNNCIDRDKLKACGRAVSDLNKIVEFAKQYAGLTKDIEEIASSIKNERNTDFIKKLQNDRISKINGQDNLKKSIDGFLQPAALDNNRDFIIEINSSSGNEETSLIIIELFRMYKRYFDKNKIKYTVLSGNLHVSGINNITLEILNKNAFRVLKNESGIHRVKSYNNHELFIDIIVMPVIEENEIKFGKKDLKIEFFHSKGHGGQSVNTTDSAVRITHLPSGITVSCQDERSQHQNKEKALKILRARIFSINQKERQIEFNNKKRIQMGFEGDGNWIRTYDFKQNKLTDHKSGVILNDLDYVLKGNLDELFEILRYNEELNRLSYFVMET
jgi:Protein chain release factor A